MEGALLGVIGSLLGLVLGYALSEVRCGFLAAIWVAAISRVCSRMSVFEPVATTIFLALGIAVSVLGSLVPALEAARARPAAALKAGSEEGALARLATPWPAVEICWSPR